MEETDNHSTFPNGEMRLPSERPFASVVGQGLNGPVRVHLERSGPAFSGERHDLGALWNEPPEHPRPIILANEPSVDDALAQSHQSHALQCAGEVLNAINRRCLLDLCASWPRLMTVAGAESCGFRLYPRKAWAWVELKEAVETALVYAKYPQQRKWQEADAVLRGYALECALSAESRTRLECGDDYYPLLQQHAARYRQFAEGGK